MQKNTPRNFESNALVELCYRPKSLNQMRLLVVVLSQVRAKEKLTYETDFTVSAGALSDMTGNSLQASYRALKRAADELMDMIVTMDILPNGESGRPYKDRMKVFSRCRYHKDKGRVVLNFTPHIIPYISNLSSQFTADEAKTMMNLKNRYGIRMYELCMQWILFGPERKITVDDFRKIFGMEDRHRNIYNLKRCVILPAIRDVNEHTDLNIEFRQVKSGLVVTHFQFVITTDIVKSNALGELCYRPISLNQMRLLVAALTQIRAKQILTHETELTVSAGALSDMTGNRLQASYKALKRAAKELMELYISVDIMPNGREGRSLKADVKVVSRCRYHKDEGKVVLKFTPDIIPYISSLSSQFTADEAKTMMNLKNRYGIRMYELCMQWILFGPEREITVEDFRKIFGMEDRHRKIIDLKRYVILPAIRDVNEHTDLDIEFRQVKSGRVITHFVFVITKK